MIAPQWSDDDHLLSALRDSVRAAGAVPRDFVEAGKAAYTWRNIDAELAALAYDSAQEDGRLTARTPDDLASLRALTFVSTELTVEIEVTGEGLLGQVVPPGPEELEVWGGNGIAAARIDELGCFSLRPLPSGPFRLHVCTSGGRSILTGWIRLDGEPRG